MGVAGVGTTIQRQVRPRSQGGLGAGILRVALGRMPTLWTAMTQ